MSWTISITKVTRQNVAELIDAAIPSGNDDCPIERNEQVVVAKSVAERIIESRALFSGDSGDEFRVDLYGHANPEHKKRDGFAPDIITVTVSRA